MTVESSPSMPSDLPVQSVNDNPPETALGNFWPWNFSALPTF